jgi:N-acetylneuraminic acid mutarotase
MMHRIGGTLAHVFLGVLLILAPAARPHAQASSEQVWTSSAPMPTPRSELAAAALRNRIYAAGGIAQFGTTAAFEAYDAEHDSWEGLPDLPEALHHLAAAATRDRVYIAGGYTDLTFSAMSRRAFAYDPEARTWAAIADLPAPRAAHAMAVVAGKLYVVGGVGPESDHVWVYDPTTDRWDGLGAPLPTRREHLAAAALDDKLLVVGGRWGDAGNLATLETYDPATGRWTRGPDMPTARSGLTAGALAGRLHVTGGEGLSSGDVFGEHEVYDPMAGRWTAGAGLPTLRHGLASAVLGERWYVIGGGTRAGALTFVSLTARVEVLGPAEQ